MPRFFFDVREGVRFTPDDDGLEFPNIDAAEHEAAECAAAIGRDLLPKGFTRAVTVESRNQHGQRVITATVTLGASPRGPGAHPARRQCTPPRTAGYGRSIKQRERRGWALRGPFLPS